MSIALFRPTGWGPWVHSGARYPGDPQNVLFLLAASIFASPRSAILTVGDVPLLQRRIFYDEYGR